MPADMTERDEALRRVLEELRNSTAGDPAEPGAHGERIDAFVRLADQSVDRLVEDSRLAAELRDAMAPEAEVDPLERLVRAQQVLTRVLCHERATVAGRGLSAVELESCVQRDGLDFEGQLHLIYELSLAGGRSWPAVRAAEASVSARQHGAPAADPVVAALRTLVAGRWRLRRPSLRRAASGAAIEPLGFCRLVVEEADELGRSESAGSVSALAQVSILLDDPFLRRESPSAWFDLRARCALYLADRSRRLGRWQQFELQFQALSPLLASGTGDPELRALEQELLAGRDLATEDPVSARRRLLRADVWLRNVQPVDRQVEVQLKYALILAAEGQTCSLAVQVLETAAGRLASLPHDVNPELRLRLVLARARVELDLVRNAVAAQLQLDGESPQTPGALRDYAEAWSRQSEQLATVTTWLDAVSVLVRRHGNRRQLAEYDELLGLSLLVVDRERAAERLRAARSAFRRLGDEAAADRTAIDLIVCCVIAGALGDQLEDWSEPLRLFRDLTERTSQG